MANTSYHISLKNYHIITPTPNIFNLESFFRVISVWVR